MPSTLPYYWQLASGQRKDRLASSHSLVETLITQQKEASVEKVALPDSSRIFDDGLDTTSPLDLDGKVVEEAEQSLEGQNSEEVTYAIRRLLKGLASHRESSRLGFSVALSELIKQLRSVPAQSLIVLVLSYSSSSGRVKVKGQEERDLLFARLFGLYAVIRSGVLSDQDLAREEDFRRVVEIVWLLGRSKTWLRESSAWIIVEALRSIAASNLPWKEGSLKWLAGKVCEAREVGSESIAIYLALSTTDLALPTLPTLTSPHLLASANLAPLARILKEGVGAESSAPNTSSGPIQAQVHFVWDMILQQYAATASGDENKASLSEVYRVLVDEALFATSASDQKKSWGFQIFEQALQIVGKDDVCRLFTINFMRTWTNQLADKNRMLFKAASNCVSAVQQAVRSNPSIGITILSQLLLKQNGSTLPTKVVESVLSCMSSSEGVVKYIEYLVSSTKSDSEFAQRWAIDQMSGLVRQSSLPITDDCICTILSLLAVRGFFTINAGPKTTLPGSSIVKQLPNVALSPNLKSVCRVRFYSCLGDVCDQSMAYIDGQGRVKRRQGHTASGQSWTSKGSDILEGLEKDASQFTALFKHKEDDAILKGRAFSRKLSKAAQRSSTPEAKAKIEDFDSMLQAGLLYLNKDLDQNQELEENLITPMIECGNRLVLGQKGQEGEPSAMELFIHCLVSYLEQPSAFLRSVATQTFASFTDEMTREAFNELLGQLGFNVDKETEDEEIEAEEEVEADDDEAEEEEDDLDDVLSDSVSVTSATSVSSTKDEAVDPVFVAKLQEVLREGGAADSDADSSAGDKDDGDSSSSASEPSDFDDDQMMLIDDKLADIFRQKLGTRKEEEEAKKETVALHIKLVDLLDVYARKQSNNELCVAMVLPLFTIALEKDPALGQLKQRAISVLNKTLCKSKDGLEGTVDDELLIGAAEAVHKMAATKLPTEAVNLCSTVNIYLTKACEEPLADSQLHTLYRATLKDFMQRKNSNLRPQFLIDAFKRLPTLGWSLQEDLLHYASETPKTAKDSYRQLQIWEMIRVSLNGMVNLSWDYMTEDIVEFLVDVSETLLNTVAKEKQRLKEIIKVALDLARLTKRLCKSQEEVERVWPPASIKEVTDKLDTRKEELPNAVSLQALLRQLLAIVSDQQKTVSNGKRKGQEQPSATKKQKRKATVHT